MDDIKKTRLKRIARFLMVNIPIVLGVLALMMVGSLKLVERYPDPIREGFQQYLSTAYQTNATIGVLDKITFFPALDLRASNITMHNNANAAQIDMAIKSIEINAPFWSLFFKTGRIDKIKIEGLQASAGFSLPHEMKIDILEIIDKSGPEQYGSFLIASGTYNNQKMTFEAEIKKLKTGYKLNKTTPFSLSIGKAQLNAQIQKNSTSVLLNNVVYAVGNKTSTARDYILFDDKVFKEDNPLHCLLHSDDVAECKVYLKE